MDKKLLNTAWIILPKEWIFCEDVQKYYKYENGHLRLPKLSPKEKLYYLENKRLQKLRK